MTLASFNGEEHPAQKPPDMPCCHGRLNTGVAFECKRHGHVTHDFDENFVTRVNLLRYPR